VLDEEQHAKTVADMLGKLKFVIHSRGMMGFTDLNLVAENFCARLLNILYGLGLENLNKGRTPASAIDLGDKKKRVCYQVTATRTTPKVQDTLDKFKEKGWDKDYDSLRIIILADKQKKYTLVNSTGIAFDPKTDILDIDDLVVAAKDRPEKLKALADLIDEQMSEAQANSKAKMSDIEAMKVYRKYFDRDALRHNWRSEGSLGRFEKALEDLSSLIQDGKVDGQQVAIGRADFSNEDEDGELVKLLAQVYRKLSKLTALYNRHVNTGEIRPKLNTFYFENRQVPDMFNQHKQAVIDAINAALKNVGIEPIEGVDPD
jgi:hypothetical protein